MPVRIAGVMGDGRTYEQCLALGTASSTGGMTADSWPFDHAFFARVATRIVNEVKASTARHMT